MKFSWKAYGKPTPKKIKKAADALLAGAMTVASISFAAEHKTVAVVVLIIAGLAKIVSNFFEDDKKDCDSQEVK